MMKNNAYITPKAILVAMTSEDICTASGTLRNSGEATAIDMSISIDNL